MTRFVYSQSRYYWPLLPYVQNSYFPVSLRSPWKYARLCSVGYVQTVPVVITPGVTLVKDFCKFCGALIPVPRTSGRSVRHSYSYPDLLEILYARGHNTRGTGTASFVPARNFCEFCTPVPQYPGTSGSSARHPYPYPELLEVM